MRFCSIHGCERSAHARELCSTHLSRLYVRGSTDDPQRQGPCLVDGCNRKAKARNLCATHVTRFYRHGETTPPVRLGADERRKRRRVQQKRIFKNYYDKNKRELLNRGAEWRRENSERVRRKNNEWKASNKERVRAHRASREGKKRSGEGRISADLVRRLFILQRRRCPVCREKLGGNYHIDHIKPLAIGGPHRDDNIQLLCPPCNMQKHAKDPIAFMQQRGFLL